MHASTSTRAPLALSTLAVAGRAGHAFTPQAMMQGYVCHARGVELAAAGPSQVRARVRSKRIHDVLLRAEDGRLAIGCTCPARSLGLDFCKHAWAALLEVDRQDALLDLRRTRGPLVVEVAPSPPERVTGATASDEPAAEPEPPRAETRPPKTKRKPATVTSATSAPSAPAAPPTVTTPAKTRSKTTPAKTKSKTTPAKTTSARTTPTKPPRKPPARSKSVKRPRAPR